MLLTRSYHFDFPHPVEKLWDLVSDTARWGEATGFPKYQANERLQDDGSVRVYGEIEVVGISIKWEELPVNWVSNHWFEQTRLIQRGPIASMTNAARLENHGDSSKLEIELKFETRNLLGSIIAKKLQNSYADKVKQLIDSADKLISSEQPDLFVSTYEPSLTTINRSARLLQKITQTPYEHGLGQQLVDYINGQLEVDLWSIRPLAIARRWQADPGQVVELFLQSVRSGLLESRWDILCPRCRVSKTTASNMSDLPKGSHCEACNIDFDSDFARNVELSFSPGPSIRPIEPGFYCRSGPGTTPHIKLQSSLAAGESRCLPLLLDKGDYRLRTLEAGSEITLSWNQELFPQIILQDNKIMLETTSASHEICIHNKTKEHRTFIIDELNWMKDVLTAEQVMTVQAFRDLFSDQVLRPGDEVSIRNVTFMFSDLVGSSSLFNELGDAEAYHIVREHFADLNQIMRTHQGSIVKTIGDGIHASFLAPENAIQAALEMQSAMPAFNERLGVKDISIRIGLHSGSSIAVTLNDRLDYYGDVVNLAARLEGQGAAGDISMSRNFSEDPAVAKLMQNHQPRYLDAQVKGYSQPVPIVQ
ncbi:MAG: adenylate/guanylate cyclase domain-containing protein, partial [Pseudomonadota bacterium]